MAQPERQEVFFVFVPGLNGEEHCLPCLGKPDVENVRKLRKSIGVRDQPSQLYRAQACIR